MTISAPAIAGSLMKRSLGLAGQIEMKHERGGDTKGGQSPGGERQLPANQKRRVRAKFQRDHQRQQQPGTW
jgi:hypothetical protein